MTQESRDFAASEPFELIESHFNDSGFFCGPVHLYACGCRYTPNNEMITQCVEHAPKKEWWEQALRAGEYDVPVFFRVTGDSQEAANEVVRKIVQTDNFERHVVSMYVGR